MTLKWLLIKGRATLEEAGITDYMNDAWLLLSDVFKIDRAYFILHENEDCSENEKRRYIRHIKKRAERVPLQQITGKAYFMGYEFKVSKDVLIPRFDTEVLCEQVISRVRDCENSGVTGVKVLDMCCGSGCIGISTALKCRRADVYCADISDKALKITNENIGRLEAYNVRTVRSDLFESIDKSFNIIVSNPPYIKSEVIETLDAEVKDHEPRIALDGGDDGLVFYRRIVDESPAYLMPDGMLMMEIGYDQGDEVANLMKEAFYRDVRVIKDLTGLDRVVIGKTPERK